jgi:hypothetical protein
MRNSRKTKARAKRSTGAARKRSAKSAAGSVRKRATKVRARSGGGAARRSSDVELEAAVLRRLLKHFDERKDVQNIELMILAGFCRNCLSKWLVEAAEERGVDFDIERAREKVYGMSYAEWKERHQQPATDEQLARFAEAERRAAERRTERKSPEPKS